MRNFSKDTKQLPEFFDLINNQMNWSANILKPLQTEVNQVNQLNWSANILKPLQTEVDELNQVNQLNWSANILKPLQTEVDELNQVNQLNWSADILKPLQTEVDELNQVNQLNWSVDILKPLQTEVDELNQVNQLNWSADILKPLQTEVDELNQVNQLNWSAIYQAQASNILRGTEVDELNQMNWSADILKPLQAQARQVYQDVGLIESVRERSGLVNESLLSVPEQIPVPDEEPEIEIIRDNWYSKIGTTEVQVILTIIQIIQLTAPGIWELLKPHLIEGIKSGNKHLTELINDLPIEEVLEQIREILPGLFILN